MFAPAMPTNIIYALFPLLFGGYSQEEVDLYNKVCQFRAQNRLNSIQISDSLSYVAKLHCINLYSFYDFNEEDCSMHSWYADKGKLWSSGCYLKNEKIMYSKPKEILGMNKEGYEIAHAHGEKSSKCSAECCFRAWLNSPGHRDQLLQPYKKIGVSIYNNYATIWFTY